MSCNKCEDAPETTYIRVGAANVEARGCPEHLKGLIGAYRAGMRPVPADVIEFGDMIRGYYRAAVESEPDIEKCKGMALLAGALMRGLGEEL